MVGNHRNILILLMPPQIHGTLHCAGPRQRQLEQEEIDQMVKPA